MWRSRQVALVAFHGRARRPMLRQRIGDDGRLFEADDPEKAPARPLADRLRPGRSPKWSARSISSARTAR